MDDYMAMMDWGQWANLARMPGLNLFSFLMTPRFLMTTEIRTSVWTVAAIYQRVCHIGPKKRKKK